MKKLLLILLCLPLIGFGQSTYQVNIKKEPVSKNAKYFVYTEIEKFSVDYSTKNMISTSKKTKDRRTFYVDFDYNKIGYITESKIKQYDIENFIEETGLISIEANPNVYFFNTRDIMWANKKKESDGLVFEKNFLRWLTDYNSKTKVYETMFILYK